MNTFEYRHALMGLPQGSNMLLTYAHPDDESMTGGLLEALKINDITPHVFYATDGEASTYGDAATLRAYGRRREASRALSHYDVQHVRFGALPDGELLGERAVELEDKISRVLQAVPFSAIVTLGAIGYDRHPDHIAVHEASLAAASQHLREGNDIRAFGLTRGEGTYLIPADPAKKLSALAEHRTQFEISRPQGLLPDSGVVVDETGLWLSTDTHERLKPYWSNHRLETYTEFDLHNVGELALIGAAEVSA